MNNYTNLEGQNEALQSITELEKVCGMALRCGQQCSTYDIRYCDRRSEGGH